MADWNAMTIPSLRPSESYVNDLDTCSTLLRADREGTRIALTSCTIPRYHWATDHCLMSVCVGEGEGRGKGRGIVQETFIIF